MPEWKSEFSFAEYDAEAGLTFRKRCRAFPRITKGNSLFYGVGGVKVRLCVLKEHSRTATHTECDGAKRSKENPTQTPIASVFNEMNAEINEKSFSI